MRLLRTDKIELVEVYGSDVEPYAILSHTWDKEEVLFQDIQHPELATCNWTSDPDTLDDLPVAAKLCFQKKGFQKVRQAVLLAQNQGFSFIWIDTCCIDKSSSAELSEAINSMFQWYKDAQVCYAYLVDFNRDQSYFMRSRWFTRGWTLQELIAPSQVQFYDANWRHFGNKTPSSYFTALIADASGVQIDVLTGETSPSRVCIASRMRWAARRQTTRVEDVAYCLLGLFDVNMPLLYGEGKRSFIRLQQEILLRYEDQSLFAWYMDTLADIHSDTLFGLLADHPDRFSETGSSEVFNPISIGGEPSAVTSKGVRVELFLVPCDSVEGADFQAILACERTGFEARQAPVIFLKRHWGIGDEYSRILPQKQNYISRSTLGEGGSWRRVFANQQPASIAGTLTIAASKHNSRLPQPSSIVAVEWEVIETQPKNLWNEAAKALEVEIRKVQIGVPIGTFELALTLNGQDRTHVYVEVGLRLTNHRILQSYCNILESGSFLGVKKEAEERPIAGINISAEVIEHHHSQGMDILLHLVDRVGSERVFKNTGLVYVAFNTILPAIHRHILENPSDLFPSFSRELKGMLKQLKDCQVGYSHIIQTVLIGIIPEAQISALLADASVQNWGALDYNSEVRRRVKELTHPFGECIQTIRGHLERLKSLLEIEDEPGDGARINQRQIIRPFQCIVLNRTFIHDYILMIRSELETMAILVRK
ncbi:heterokaryon incompatibility protein-domain-containing protein [Cercophora samala]|uniref:Heterokaryon incompatibility protein-domain-containing protein n=1 Tax=Cercophora samala TaxID=330535 RepID=A0AA39ZIV8_9PEZI|nr:heterokaryon incompatibility protein-domain-containing protein [Cercophora samala]